MFSQSTCRPCGKGRVIFPFWRATLSGSSPSGKAKRSSASPKRSWKRWKNIPISINLPALREREGDIPLLARHFVRKFAERQGKAIECISEEVMEALEKHSDLNQPAGLAGKGG